MPILKIYLSTQQTTTQVEGLAEIPYLWQDMRSQSHASSHTQRPIGRHLVLYTAKIQSPSRILVPELGREWKGD